jgi:hypothetical protein
MHADATTGGHDNVAIMQGIAPATGWHSSPAAASPRSLYRLKIL